MLRSTLALAAAVLALSACSGPEKKLTKKEQWEQMGYRENLKSVQPNR
ncbi:hypothetical protein [Acetobacter sp. AN02]|nr:hypothetical protein [Acetobacter sp. AN02]